MSKRELTVKTDENTLVMVINYETQSIELFNGAGKPLRVEGEIDKGDGYMKIDIRVDVKK